MPTRVPFHSVVVSRKVGGQLTHVRPKIGEPFEFTEEEIVHFHKNDSRSLRLPVMERMPVPVSADLGDDGDDSGDSGDDTGSEVTSDKTAPTARTAVRSAGRKGVAKPADTEDPDEL